MKFAERRKLIDRQSFVAQYVSLAILSIGESTSNRTSADPTQVAPVSLEVMTCFPHLLAAVLLPGSQLIPDQWYRCADLMSYSGFFNKATEDAVFSNVIDLLFNCAAFIYIGAIIPFDAFNDADYGVSPLTSLHLLD